MSDAISITIDSNAAQLVARANAFPVRMMKSVAAALDYENELTVGQIQRTKLSRRGPSTLGVVTNRLRLSVRPAKAEIIGDHIESSIGSNVRYAGVHEYGFHGTVPVRAFNRKNPQRDLVAVNHETITRRAYLTGNGALAKRKPKVVASGVSQVRAHTMKMNFPARAYIRTTIEERRQDYGKSVSDAVRSAFTSP